MPHDWYLASRIGKELYNSRIAGLDIKTQVTTKDDHPVEVVVAIPMLPGTKKENIKKIVQTKCGCVPNIIINGTGKYVKHGPVADCGTTGRKLAVDFYGGNCRIGGGSPWTKDGTKADLSLNLYARKLALDYIKRNPRYSEVHCAISCKIGSSEITIAYFDKHMFELEETTERIAPAELILAFRLDQPRFAMMCMDGLFS